MKIKLFYRRLPDRASVYEQELLYEDEEVLVSRAVLRPRGPLVHNGKVLIGADFYAVWFVFRGAWHDLGKIYRPDGEFHGYYCDIIRPARRTPTGVEITDLFLDLWVFPDGRWLVLDRDEFETAIRRGWLTPELAARAQHELETLIAAVEGRRFPPAIVARFGLNLDKAGPKRARG